jgi:hypothetical protein
MVQWKNGLVALGLVVLSGCVTDLTSSPVPPPSEPTFVELPFQKLINPAFLDEVSGKWVQSVAAFGGTVDLVLDLPEEYQSGYVRLRLFAPDMTGGNSTNDVVIPKSKSDPVFDMTMGTKVTVYGRAQPITRTYRGGQKASGFLLLVERIEPLP